MRIRLEWFIVPCVATMFGGSALSVKAQDPPKVRVNVVHTQVQGDIDAKSIRDKVAKELEASGISQEAKARILKDVEEALSKVKEAGKKAKKAIVKGVEIGSSETKADDTKAEDAKADVGEATIVIQKKSHSPNTTHAFTTQIYRDPKNDGYRIGIQYSQVDSEQGDADKDATKERPGLEVKAVMDDSPAKKAGIEEGDVLISVNGSKITKISDLTSAVQEAGKKDKELTIELQRNEKVVNVTVKPTKMKSSDIELENIQLSLPTGGFVFDNPESVKTFQEQMKKWGSGNMPSGGAQVWNFQGDPGNLKKDLEELKFELAELKKMIKELVDKR